MKRTVIVVATEKNWTDVLLMKRAKADVTKDRAGEKAMDQDALYAAFKSGFEGLSLPLLPDALLLAVTFRSMNKLRADTSDGNPGGVSYLPMAARTAEAREGCVGAATFVDSSV